MSNHNFKDLCSKKHIHPFDIRVDDTHVDDFKFLYKRLIDKEDDNFTIKRFFDSIGDIFNLPETRRDLIRVNTRVGRDNKEFDTRVIENFHTDGFTRPLQGMYLINFDNKPYRNTEYVDPVDVKYIAKKCGFTDYDNITEIKEMYKYFCSRRQKVLEALDIENKIILKLEPFKIYRVGCMFLHRMPKVVLNDFNDRVFTRFFEYLD